MLRTGTWLAVALAVFSSVYEAAPAAARESYAVGIRASTRSGTERKGK